VDLWCPEHTTGEIIFAEENRSAPKKTVHITQYPLSAANKISVMPTFNYLLLNSQFSKKCHLPNGLRVNKLFYNWISIIFAQKCTLLLI